MDKQAVYTGEQADEHGQQGSLSSYVEDIFESFANARTTWEEIWEEAWLNFLGQYQTGTRWMKEMEGKGSRSRVFIKLTTLKCHTAHSKIMDASFPGDGSVPFDGIPVNFRELGIEPEVAMEIAKKMKGRIEDHFKLIELKESMDTAILECAVLGTAVLKGPIIEMKEVYGMKQRMIGGVPASDFSGDINPYERTVEKKILPVVDHIPLWEYYVDSNAKTPAESIMEFHFQRMLPAEFLKLAGQGGYNASAIKEAHQRTTMNDANDKRYIQLGEKYIGEQGKKDEKISVLEGWGWVPAGYLRQEGCHVPQDIPDERAVEALVVLAADGIVIKACMNPLGRRAFYVCPYKKRPHVIYGMGVAEAMRDSQKMVNSAARMMIDNKAMSGAGMVAINATKLDMNRTKDLKIYPYKTWWVKHGVDPKEAIQSVTFQDTTRGLQELIELFERFADEETGIPKYTHGEQGSFLNKTATGMSMLMTQANINLKTVMRNIDRFWIEPIVESFYDWFMDMESDNSIKIPLKIKATGTDSLMAKEIKIESILKFMQMASSPQDAMFMDRVKMMRLISNYLDIEDVMRSEEEIQKIMAELEMQSQTPPNLRETVDIDRLYPILTRFEQRQVLEDLGIEPDPNPPNLPMPPGTDLTNPSPGAPAFSGEPEREDLSEQNAA